MGIAKCAIAPALAIWPTAGGPPGQNVDFPLRLVIAPAIGPTRLAPKHFSSRIIFLLGKKILYLGKSSSRGVCEGTCLRRTNRESLLDRLARHSIGLCVVDSGRRGANVQYPSSPVLFFFTNISGPECRVCALVQGTTDPPPAVPWF